MGGKLTGSYIVTRTYYNLQTKTKHYIEESAACSSYVLDENSMLLCSHLGQEILCLRQLIIDNNIENICMRGELDPKHSASKK